MKVAFITLDPSFATSGSGTYATYITRHLARLGHEMHLILPRSSSAPASREENEVLRHEVPFIDRPLVRAASFWMNLRKQFPRLHREVGRFDIVHSHDLSDWSLGVRHLSGTPRVTTVHHLSVDSVAAIRPSARERLLDTRGELGYVKPHMERECIRRADAIISVSDFTKTQVVSHCHILPDRVTVIYPGHARRHAAGVPDEPELRQRLGLRLGQPMLLFVGDPDSRRKGFDILRLAFAQVRRETDAVLVAIGGHPATENRLAAKQDGIVRAGFVDDAVLGALYGMCDIFVSAARLEGFGLAILDAMAAGKPVVATRVGAVPEVLRENENGLLVDSENPDQMATALMRLLTDPPLASAIGMRNAVDVPARFDWTKSAQQTAAIYRRLLDEAPRVRT